MRYKTKLKVKKIAYLSLLLVALFVGGSYGAPYIDSIEEKISNLDSLKSSDLSIKNRNIIGDTVLTEDGLSITFVEFDLVDSYYISKTPENRRSAPNGAKYLFIRISITNVGEIKTPLDTVLISYHAPSIYYADSSMPLKMHGLSIEYTPVFDGYGSEYPGVTKEGWIRYEVPAGIDLTKTTLKIHGVEWKFE